MGLMICKHLVEMNQGAIEVHSDGKDQGSTFTFTMKMQQVDAKRKNMIGYFADKNDETSKQIDGDSSQRTLLPEILAKKTLIPNEEHYQNSKQLKENYSALLDLA